MQPVIINVQNNNTTPSYPGSYPLPNTKQGRWNTMHFVHMDFRESKNLKMSHDSKCKMWSVSKDWNRVPKLVCLFFFSKECSDFFFLSCRKLDFRSKTFKTFPVASTLRIFPLLGLSCRSRFQFSLWFGAPFHPAVSAHPSCNTFPSHHHWSK